jgi:hypothetical protein
MSVQKAPARPCGTKQKVTNCGVEPHHCEVTEWMVLYPVQHGSDSAPPVQPTIMGLPIKLFLNALDFFREKTDKIQNCLKKDKIQKNVQNLKNVYIQKMFQFEKCSDFKNVIISKFRNFHIIKLSKFQ